MTKAPRVFASYSHDDQDHKNWVLNLATRLVRNGVDVILDQWDLTLGSDLPRFMENGLTGADRVLAVCTGPYVAKANGGQGGVGYEKMVLTAQVMQDIASDRIIPIVRRNSTTPVVPTFLSSRMYVDFREDAAFEVKYSELLRDIHGQQISPRPTLGANPFLVSPPAVDPVLSFALERYASPATSGTVTFDFSNNNGRFIVGAGDMAFETAWSGAGTDSIHAYSDAQSITSIALVADVASITQICDATQYDSSSRTRTPMVGEIVVWRNTAGYYLATQIKAVKRRGNGSAHDELTFAYAIAPSKLSSFTNDAV
jgi:hypothetical protein